MNYGHRKPATEMRFVLSSLPMRMAFYLLTILLLLFLTFAWKRKQRIIPIHTPLRNSSTDLVETLCNLYLSNKNNGLIANYIIKNFKIKTNRKYLIKWNQSINQIKEQLLVKSGKSDHEVDALIKHLNLSQNKQEISQLELIKLNKIIQEFIS